MGLSGLYHFHDSMQVYFVKQCCFVGFMRVLMKQSEDKFTRDAFDAPKAGRPRSPNALTPAQRAKRYRARKKVLQ